MPVPWSICVRRTFPARSRKSTASSRTSPRTHTFYEVLGNILVSMGQPLKGVAPFQKSVDLMPDAPELRALLAQAQIATESLALEKVGIENLKISLQQDNDQPFAWYLMAQAYSDLKNEPMANLATAERYYTIGALQPAAIFAVRARQALAKGSPDWERANDIVAVASAQLKQNRN